MRSALLFIAIFIGLVVAQNNEKKGTYSEIFETSSDFMKGFETGILLRTKNGKIEDFGCVIPADALGQEAEQVFKNISQAF